jgi:hypothetical protein
LKAYCNDNRKLGISGPISPNWVKEGDTIPLTGLDDVFNKKTGGKKSHDTVPLRDCPTKFDMGKMLYQSMGFPLIPFKNFLCFRKTV